MFFCELRTFLSGGCGSFYIADLIAYPLTRHVLNPQAVNLAYDILEPNIFKEKGKLMGLKIYPTQ